jgi:RND family efflux transporter MFP subunit
MKALLQSIFKKCHKGYLALVIIIVLIVIGALWWWLSAGAAKPAAAPQPVVQIIKAHNATVPQTIEALGSVLAPHDVTLMAQSAGDITGVYFTPGQRVQGGAKLIQVNPVAANAALLQAQGAMLQAKSDYARYTAMAKISPTLVAKSDLSKYHALYVTALGQVAAAQKDVLDTTIFAPFSGTISAFQPVRGQVDQQGNSLSNVTQTGLGSYVTVGQALVDIVDRTQMVVEYKVPESALAILKAGQAVTFTTHAFSGKKLHATLSYISPTINSQNRTVTLRAKLSNATTALRPGALVYVSTIIKAKRTALVVPQIALQSALGGYSVFTVNAAGRVATQNVSIGERFGKNIVITKGVKAGEVVIIGGQQKVHQGVVVTTTTQALVTQKAKPKKAKSKKPVQHKAH